MKVGDKVRLLPLTEYVLEPDDTLAKKDDVYYTKEVRLQHRENAKKQVGEIAVITKIETINTHTFLKRDCNLEIAIFHGNTKLLYFWPLSCLELVEKEDEQPSDLPPGYRRTEDGFITCDDNWTAGKRWF